MKRVLLLALLLGVAPARADEPDPLARLARARAGVKTLSGPFTQERTIALLATKIRSAGRFALAMPDRLRWELAAPDDAVYWIGPEGIAYRTRSGSGRLPAGAPGASTALAAVADLRGFLAGDLPALRARYDLRVVEAGPESTVVEATPRPPRPGSAEPAARGPQRVRLTLGADLTRPREILLVFSPREETRITFGELTRDAPLDPASLRPPP